MQYIYDVQRYVITGSYEAVQFYPLWDFDIYMLVVRDPITGEYEYSDNDFYNIFFSLMMYVIQVTGNKPVSLFINLLTGSALSLHPFTVPLAVYYFA